MTDISQDSNLVTVLDSTLRDGAQTLGVTFSVDEKIAIAQGLDEIGVDFIEGGYPGANPRDDEFFVRRPHLHKSQLSAFGMVRRAGRSVENDPGVVATIGAGSPVITFVGKSSTAHVKRALGITLEDNLSSIESSIAAAVEKNKTVIFDCEHFFDGFVEDEAYAMSVVESALEAGARYAVLCDTNGGTLPVSLTTIIQKVVDRFGGQRIGFHGHDDTGNAVANTLAAIDAGARHIQGTLNGLGERCGNANLITVIMSLLLKAPYRDWVRLNIDREDLSKLTDLSHRLDLLLNQASNPAQPYVGARAFAHKGGIHASAVKRAPELYEHVDPQIVSAQRSVLISDQSGKANVIDALQRHGVKFDNDSSQVERVLSAIKEQELQGYSYENAEASFVVLAESVLGLSPEFFRLQSFRCIVESRENALSQHITQSEAVVRLRFGSDEVISVGEGNGPVHALDHAMRSNFGPYSDVINRLDLVDYKVRIIATPKSDGTSAVTRVMVESKADDDQRWWTVGVSPNIVEASAIALCDSFRFALRRAGVSVCA